MKYLFSTIIIVFVKLSLAQNCTGVTEESLTVIGPYPIDIMYEADGLRDGPDYDGATVYYPTGLTYPRGSIVIVPGFFAEQTDIQEWGPFLASHGIITMTIGTNNLWDQPGDRANALIDGIETLKQENTRADSPLEGIVNIDKFAVAGWSMGGGGAQLAAVLDPSISAVMAFCPWLDPNETPILNHSVPVLIFSGEEDPTAPPAQHANIHYAETPDQTDKVLYEIEGGVHDVANAPTGGNGEVGKLGLAWLHRYLIGNYCYCPVILNDLLYQPSVTSGYSYNINCDLLSLTPDDESKEVNIYPNPTNQYITVDRNYNEEINYSIYSLTGKLALTGALTEMNQQIDLTELNIGVYYVTINSISYRILKM
jgi:dienelactone hydrolase